MRAKASIFIITRPLPINVTTPGAKLQKPAQNNLSSLHWHLGSALYSLTMSERERGDLPPSQKRLFVLGGGTIFSFHWTPSKKLLNGPK